MSPDPFAAAKLFLQDRYAYWTAKGLAPGPAHSYALGDLDDLLRKVNPKFYPIEDEI